ncbi:hypothetical protein JOF36_007662 [Pseudonocardia parietis]|uniref:DUF4190 domain-containing protein n=1 Tax=Pseudonocardia parietis TaxID=570936 RepID=A0ABS4W8C9_9PSEU|nr:hypothetical protein [Pseudonocardia parietis]
MPRPATARPRGYAALALGALGAAFVAVAIVLAIGTPLAVAGLVASSLGVVLTGAGLVLGTRSVACGRARGDRTAIAAAGISVAGLACGLTWLAVFVLTAMSGGPVGPDLIGVEQPACTPLEVHAHR